MNIYNKAFKRDYDKMFKKDPATANMMILFLDIADEKGEFTLNGTKEEQAEQIAILMNIRFENCEEYQL